MPATCTEDILRDNCSELDFYIYCRNVAEDILYDMVFPLYHSWNQTGLHPHLPRSLDGAGLWGAGAGRVPEDS